MVSLVRAAGGTLLSRSHRGAGRQASRFIRFRETKTSINRVLPTSLKSQNIPEYLKNRLEMQEHYLKVIDTTFGNQILASVPEMERDVTGLPMIEKMAKAMFGDF